MQGREGRAEDLGVRLLPLGTAGAEPDAVRTAHHQAGVGIELLQPLRLISRDRLQGRQPEGLGITLGNPRLPSRRTELPRHPRPGSIRILGCRRDGPTGPTSGVMRLAILTLWRKGHRPRQVVLGRVQVAGEPRAAIERRQASAKEPVVLAGDVRASHHLWRRHHAVLVLQVHHELQTLDGLRAVKEALGGILHVIHRLAPVVVDELLVGPLGEGVAVDIRHIARALGEALGLFQEIRPRGVWRGRLLARLLKDLGVVEKKRCRLEVFRQGHQLALEGLALYQVGIEIRDLHVLCLGQEGVEVAHRTFGNQAVQGSGVTTEDIGRRAPGNLGDDLLVVAGNELDLHLALRHELIGRLQEGRIIGGEVVDGGNGKGFRELHRGCRRFRGLGGRSSRRRGRRGGWGCRGRGLRGIGLRRGRRGRIATARRDKRSRNAGGSKAKCHQASAGRGNHRHWDFPPVG